MSRMEDNCKLIQLMAMEKDKDPDIKLDAMFRPILLSTLIDISISLAVIADKLGGNEDDD